MTFLADRVVDISVLEGKSFSMDCACSAIGSIISNSIFIYGTEFTVDLVLSLSVLIFCSIVVSCSHAAFVCRVDVIIYATIFLFVFCMVFIYMKTPLGVSVNYSLESIQDLLPTWTVASFGCSGIFFPSDSCEIWVSVNETKIYMER